MTRSARRGFGGLCGVNRALRRVMETSGLTLARVFWEDWEDPLPGREEGEVEYALTRAEWQRQAEGLEAAT